MHIKPFRLERYFAQHEFASRFLLSSSDCDGLALAEVLALADEQTRQLWEQLRLGYTESLGMPLLRAEVARGYAGVASENVLIAAPEEAVFIAMNCLLSAGDHIVCTYPGYQSLYEVARSLGCQVSFWQPHEAEGWRFDPSALRSALQPNTRAVVCNFPHNPTGYLPTPGGWQEIVDIVAAHGCYLFSDEMYRGLELAATSRLPSAIEVYAKAIALSGMSKTMGMAGVRIGWLVTHDIWLYERMAGFKDYTTICSSAPSEVLALMALRASDQILERHRARIAHNRNILSTFMARHTEQFAWNPPRAGTVCFPRVLMREGAASFCAAASAEAGLMLLPSTVFDYGDEHIRLGLGRADLSQALEALDVYLQQRRF